MTVQPVAPSASVACPIARPQSANEITSNPLELLRSLGGGDFVLRTCAACHHAAEITDDADESAAFDAGIPFGPTLLVATCAADHRVPLVQCPHYRPSARIPVVRGSREVPPALGRGAGANAPASPRAGNRGPRESAVPSLRWRDQGWPMR